MTRRVITAACDIITVRSNKALCSQLCLHVWFRLQLCEDLPFLQVIEHTQVTTEQVFSVTEEL